MFGPLNNHFNRCYFIDVINQIELNPRIDKKTSAAHNCPHFNAYYSAVYIKVCVHAQAHTQLYTLYCVRKFITFRLDRLQNAHTTHTQTGMVCCMRC